MLSNLFKSRFYICLDISVHLDNFKSLDSETQHLKKKHLNVQ